MIIKGHARGRYLQLARHLLNASENERIQLYECRGTISQTVEGALAEMEAHGKVSRSKRPLYHASISPEPGMPLTEAQLALAVEVLEAKLGFAGQPRVVVTHRKHERDHAHVVWSRIDRTGKAISDSWNYAQHEEAARELERHFGHDRVEGVHRRAGDAPRPARTAKEYELRQAARSGLDPKAIQDELTRLWTASDTGKEFRAAIEAAGYRLVRGDRRGFVVLDRAGEAHSLSRRLDGGTAAAMRAKLADIDLARLPAVTEARTAKAHRNSVSVETSTNTMLTAFTLSSGRRSRLFRFRVGAGSTYAADRASILAEFAARFAAACRPGTAEEVRARIARLRDEESAALAALKRRMQPGTSGKQAMLGGAFREAGRQVTLRRAPAPRSAFVRYPAT